ncbi:hypothetical protein BT69DRAFT_1334099 [Atractiella rhizophila]|nr:hypothetical protein BT69DRAFT_1334099 [Atractiella rhizophila]
MSETAGPYLLGGPTWDASAIGLVSSFVLGLGIGIPLLVVFSFVHLKYRSFYFPRTFFPPPASRSSPPRASDGKFTWLWNPFYTAQRGGRWREWLYGPPYPWLRPPNSPMPTLMDGDGGKKAEEVFLNDEHLHLRTLALFFRIVLLWSLCGLLIGLPLYTVGVPTLAGLAEEGTIGRYASLDQLNLLRLLRAYDIEKDVGAQGSFHVDGLSAGHRLIVITAFALTIPIVGTLWLLKEEFDLVIQNRRQFREVYCKGLEIGFLGVNAWKRSWLWGWRGRGKKRYQLKGMSDVRLRELLVMCGLGPEEEGSVRAKEKDREGRRRKESGFGWMARLMDPNASSQPSRLEHETKNSRFRDVAIAYGGLDGQEQPPKEIAVEGVYMVGDTSELEKLEKQRRKVVDQLEEAEARYLASFEPFSGSLEEVDIPKSSGSRGLRRFSFDPLHLHRSESPTKAPAHSTNSRNEVLLYAPSLHYSLRPAAPNRSFSGPKYLFDSSEPRPESPNIVTLFRQKTHGASFTEVNIEDENNEAYRQFPLGSQIRVNQSGRLEPVTPTAATFLQSDTTIQSSDHAGDSTVKPSPPLMSPAEMASMSSLSRLNRSFSTVSHKPSVRISKEERRPEPLILRGGSASLSPGPQRGMVISLSLDSVDQSDAESGRELSIATEETERAQVGDDMHSDGAATPIPMSSVPLHPLDPSDDFETATITHPFGEARINFSSDVDQALFPRRMFSDSTRPYDRSYSQAGSGKRSASNLTAPHFRVQTFRPYLRPIPTTSPTQLADLYNTIRRLRSQLKRLNPEIQELQRQVATDLEEGKDVCGWVLVGKGLRHLQGIQMVEGSSREDIVYQSLDHPSFGPLGFWIGWFIVSVCSAALLSPATALSVLQQPGVANYFNWLRPVLQNSQFVVALLTTLIPALLSISVLAVAITLISLLAKYSDSTSRTRTKINAFRGSLAFIIVIDIGWFISLAAVIFASNDIQSNSRISRSLADGAIATSTLFFVASVGLLVLPGLLVLRLRDAIRIQLKWKKIVTPRARFQALRPRTFNAFICSSFISFSILSFSFFFMIAPLLAIPLIVVLPLTFATQRFNVSQVFTRSSQSGGRYATSIILCASAAVCTQPLLLGFVLLSRDRWTSAGLCFAVAFVALITSCVYWRYTSGQVGRKDLHPTTQAGLRAFEDGARLIEVPEEQERLSSSAAASAALETNRRHSMASILDLLNHLDTPSDSRGLQTSPRKARAVPISTEIISNDYGCSKLVSRTHSMAPPSLPPLPFSSQDDTLAREMLYNPVLITKDPIVILPRDLLSREEADDSQKYWGIEAVYQDSVPLSALPGLKASPRPEDAALDIALPPLPVSK